MVDLDQLTKIGNDFFLKWEIGNELVLHLGKLILRCNIEPNGGFSP